MSGLGTWVNSGDEKIRRGLLELHGLFGEDVFIYNACGETEFYDVVGNST